MPPRRGAQCQSVRGRELPDGSPLHRRGTSARSCLGFRACRLAVPRFAKWNRALLRRALYHGNRAKHRDLPAAVERRLAGAVVIGSSACGMFRLIFAFVLLVLALRPAAVAECSGHPGALGTERVLALDPANTGPVGRKQFAATLPLEATELVLTFDDGPLPGPTERVLAALKQECVRATFFMLGRNAVAHPALAKRVATEGHTVAHHSYSHRLLKNLSLPRAEAEIDLGIAAVDAAAYGEPGAGPRTPFFRFPGFASNPALLAMLAERGIVVFGA